MIEKILFFIVEMILNWALKKAQSEVVKREAEAARDQLREEVNHDNVERYNAAVDRADRVRRAVDLLNRNRS